MKTNDKRLIMDIRIGAYYTNKYRNLFHEFGYSEEKIMEKINITFQEMFYGDENTRIYHPEGIDAGYLVDTGNYDVRSEGMSYGMMMCVQLNKQEEFDRIWTWTKRYMWHADGEYAGYFAWSLNIDGTRRYQGPAPDGEEFFAMALLFAAHRWGDRQAPYNYSQQAKDILKACVHKGEEGVGDPMWDPTTKLIKFVPGLSFSDPSYHLPHFYELFSIWGNPEDKEFWTDAAAISRQYLQKTCHAVTGLAPEYANYDGTPHIGDGHEHFYSDSYRVVANIGLDYEWFKKDEWQVQEANRIQEFFYQIGLDAKYYTYTIEGIALDQEALHPVGLLATNAMASLAANGKYKKAWVDKLWETPLRTGDRRYYDNCLYLFSLLALSGNYRIW